MGVVRETESDSEGDEWDTEDEEDGSGSDGRVGFERWNRLDSME